MFTCKTCVNMTSTCVNMYSVIVRYGPILRYSSSHISNGASPELYDKCMLGDVYMCKDTGHWFAMAHRSLAVSLTSCEEVFVETDTR